MTSGALALLGLLVVLLAGLPIAFALGLFGYFGIWSVRSFNAANTVTVNQIFDLAQTHTFTVLPLFILMGNLIARARISHDLYAASNAFLGHYRGGLAMATIAACGGFSAVSGSSMATASTMSRVAMPPMRRHGYSDALAAGSITAGGTLGILIPPSVVLVIYAILAEQNVAKLFVAAFVPGILAAVGYMVAIALYVRLYPGAAGSSPRRPWRERFAALAEVWPVAAVFLAVVGGIYAGWFTPTEAAAVGAAGTGLIALANGGLTRQTLTEAILATATSTAMIFFIVFGAAMYNSFLALSQLPVEAAAFITGRGLDPWTVLAGILIFYLVLGCFMDSLSMILLTVPIFFPLVSGLDFGMSAEEFAIWFGILVLVVVEVGLITPPVGMNLFVINSMAKDVPILATYRGVAPFVLSDLVRTVVLVAFPAISLFMVRWLY